MKGFLTWRIGILSCGATVAMVLIVWKRLKHIPSDKMNTVNRKDDECKNKVSLAAEQVCGEGTQEIKELPQPSWAKVGEIKELYFYPLKSGRGREVHECEFTEYGIALEDKAGLTLRDRMFLVYNEDTGKFVTGRNYPTLILVSLTAVDDSRVRLQATGVPNLTFALPKSSNDPSAVNCKMWWGEPVKCIDCGPAPAQWISNFLTGTHSGLRVGIALAGRRNILKGPWERFTKVYETLRSEDTGFFADLASYMLMSKSSLDELNRKLNNPISPLQFRPNIVVAGAEPFDEDNWEWIKIGDNVVIRNVKPCPRCSMIGIDPQTGVLNEQEPFKVLKSFREQTDERRIKVDGKAPVMGIYCGLYSTGNVKIGDDVFVHMPKTLCATPV
ncbi:mitochondrial amidoxime-reducing component 1 [Diachasma alloeum]|uniref:mitochondrial amidoxime-reducing component 1 n=1 Tax=Diachasma alloeum TaxID=454923 RepID=UPI0007383DBE|nr:mitochondrial amidoxime-reducing component 1 [Diachasma alloeum]